ncbi:MAG: type I pullulanase [Acholeplasmataceae bacterium]
MRAFIDDLNIIRIESDQFIHDISIEGEPLTFKSTEGFFQYFESSKALELHLTDKIRINHAIYPLEIGLVTLKDAFDKKYRYDGALGALYSKSETTFRLFSPVAKEVYVVIDGTYHQMSYELPIYHLTLKGDLEGLSYHYHVRLVDQFKDVKDPYAVGATVDHNIIIDWDKTLKLKKTPIKVKNYVDAVIYEGHIRDMSIGLDVESPGLFEGIIEESPYLKQSVLSYIKKLGMTHLQLLPVYDFEGVDDLKKDALYNWGYNPSQYFCVEGWFSRNPNDPYARISEFKNLIFEAHEKKLGIIVDVVFNHVYQHQTFPYDDLVPGYFFRHDKNFQMTDAAFVGNDVETRHYMVRKLIVDNLMHWVTHYQIDGFRFDLMGLLDIDTMLAIEDALKKINPYIMLYGEGWNMTSEVTPKKRSNMSNQAQFTSFAHFNDQFRNVIKGELHGPGMGFATGNKALITKSMPLLLGSPHLFTSPNQSINYVECHDNLTFYDKMLLSCGFQNPDFKYAQDFANHLIAISQGIPFYHAGQEFYRSKKGVENSYNCPDEINKIHWSIHQESIKKLRKLLSIRKKYALYRQTAYSHQARVEKDHDILIYTLEDDNVILKHYIKSHYGLQKLTLDGGSLIFPSQYALAEDHFIVVDQPGIYILLYKK